MRLGAIGACDMYVSFGVEGSDECGEWTNPGCARYELPNGESVVLAEMSCFVSEAAFVGSFRRQLHSHFPPIPSHTSAHLLHRHHTGAACPSR